MILSAVNVEPRMTPIAQWLGATDPENFVFAYTMLYIILNILTVIVFNLGFARKLVFLKTVMVYILMLIGNVAITFLAFSLPIIESLFVAAVVLGIYKIQLRRHKQEEGAAAEK
ncbi:YlaH-like protein [Evansella caseinilytica]|uniref:YlaH-like protein n=1 Tax=Evansella caseinilytica TaxID=1503961 RepID=A0A1H3MP35_9BACI|nr:YlaH-like family protein [Evansella caseinilytica]SDY77859.1 YlaH-like protein [Evansella caseinilytica]